MQSTKESSRQGPKILRDIVHPVEFYTSTDCFVRPFHSGCGHPKPSADSMTMA